ncbi:MAG TPA: hypothetical protein VFX03_16595, partial [Thermomicrobiales bacterium]|nr:hypothetical protein [Thermomicrobiales bacterium]
GPSGHIPQGRQSTLDLAALPAAEAEVLAKAMHARPEQRFANCRQMVAALEQCARAAPIAAPATPPERSPAAPWSGTIVSPSAAPSGEVQIAEAPAAGSIADTTPETEPHGATVVDPFSAGAEGGAPAPRRRGRAGRLFAATALAAALTAGYVVGDDVRQDVDRLAAQGRYDDALKAVDQADYWRRWRTDAAALKREVAQRANAAAVAEPDAERIEAACSVYAALAAIPNVLLVQDTNDFRERLLPLAIELAERRTAEGEFEQAGRIQQRLAAVLRENVKVITLKDYVLEQAGNAARTCAQQDDFKTAAKICRQLREFAAGSRQLDELNFDVIRLGSLAVQSLRERKEFAAALNAYGELEAAFPDDHGVRDVASGLIPAAIGAVEKAIEEQRVVEAAVVYRELAKLRPHDSKIERLGAGILERECEGVRRLLKEEKWGGALTDYERIAADWPEARLDELREPIVKAAKEEFEARSKAGQAERAKEIKGRLTAAFPKDASIRNWRESGPSPEAPEIAKLLDDADAYINDGVLDKAAANNEQVERLLKADAAGSPILRRRLALAEAHVALLRKAWDETLERLGAIQPGEFDEQAESTQRTRFYVLRALAAAKFDGGQLAAEVPLDQIAESIQETGRHNPDWPHSSAHRVAIARFKLLIERIIARAADSAPDE